MNEQVVVLEVTQYRRNNRGGLLDFVTIRRTVLPIDYGRRRFLSAIIGGMDQTLLRDAGFVDQFRQWRAWVEGGEGE